MYMEEVKDLLKGTYFSFYKLSYYNISPIPVAARCKAWVCLGLPAEVMGANSAGA
jgi:hypothetical protein